jgi:hypothetical protein
VLALELLDWTEGQKSAAAASAGIGLAFGFAYLLNAF